MDALLVATFPLAKRLGGGDSQKVVGVGLECLTLEDTLVLYTVISPETHVQACKGGRFSE
jgi:hypothetical protein